MGTQPSAATLERATEATTEQRILAALFDLAAEWDRDYQAPRRAVATALGLRGRGPVTGLALTAKEQLRVEELMGPERDALTDLHARVAAPALAEARRLALLVDHEDALPSIRLEDLITKLTTGASRRELIQPIFEAAGIADRLLDVGERADEDR